MSLRTRILRCTAALILTAATAGAADRNVVLVLDASGSMWGEIGGRTKIEIAREAIGQLVETWDDEVALGLVAYGHRSKGDCDDIETVIAPGAVDRQAFSAAVRRLVPKGKTPITAALAHASELLRTTEASATVILISDGIETCAGDPCAAAKRLEAEGVDFTIHVVGFDLQDDEQAQLTCVAELTGGLFVPARDAAALESALTRVDEAIAAASATLVNGSFEQSAVPGNWRRFALGEELAGWIVTAGDVEVIHTYWSASHGEHSVDLNGGVAGAIAQTIRTIPGSTYRVAFDLAANPDSRAPEMAITVRAGDDETTFRTASVARTRANLGWTREEWTFVAGSETTTIEFASATPEGGVTGPVIDNVEVRRVP